MEAFVVCNSVGYPSMWSCYVNNTKASVFKRYCFIQQRSRYGSSLALSDEREVTRKHFKSYYTSALFNTSRRFEAT